VHHRLHLLCTTLVFHRFIGRGITYVKRNLAHVQAKSSSEAIYSGPPFRSYQAYHSFAICQEVMTEGKHYAEFTVTQRGYIMPGIMRPIQGLPDAAVNSIRLNGGEGYTSTRSAWPNWQMIIGDYQRICREQSGRPGFEGSKHIGFYSSSHSYERAFLEKDDVIGLLLDLDVGVLKFYENGSEKGMADVGISGHYCWMAMISRTSNDRGAVKVEHKLSLIRY